ncbi:MAG TPA: nuclease-related domain-containing protein [Dermatophilaceae bacterium]|nr:nuclease-related domain-containing protein [Dermatophilaceae bacterium]
MTDWIVRRWARYGHERLYAETPGGTALGYLDLKTGRYHSDDLSNLPLLEKAIGDHLAGKEPKQVTSDAPVEEAEALAVDAPAEPVLPAWEDISGHAAGSAVREQALAARDAQGKVRHFLARAFDVKTEERAWRIGAAGEQAVASQLAKLGSEWRVLHSVEVGDRGSDIDHLLVGPGGVLTVNAKNHPNANVWVGGDTFMVNGQRVPYIRNSRHEAQRAGRLLTEQVGFPVAVLGVIAVIGAHKGFKIKKQPEDGEVVIVQRRRISRYVENLPRRLTDREIDAIYELARRSTTWRRSC